MALQYSDTYKGQTEEEKTTSGGIVITRKKKQLLTASDSLHGTVVASGNLSNLPQM